MIWIYVLRKAVGLKEMQVIPIRHCSTKIAQVFSLKIYESSIDHSQRMGINTYNVHMEGPLYVIIYLFG
jgi:hypothetical protein